MTACFRFLWLILLIPGFAAAQNTDLLDEIKAHESGLGVWWVGHNGWLIKSGDLLISTDLLLHYDKRIEPPPVSAEQLAAELDISFVTHYHGDHFNRDASKILVEQSECIFVLPESCLKVAEELGIPEERIVVARPRQEFEIMGIKVKPLRAIHGNADFSIYYQANLQDCGYHLTIDGTTFLQPGDSYLLEDHLFLEHVDVLFFSPTEHNTYIDRSLIMINRLNPDYILPQHHSTVVVTDDTRFWAKGYPEEVKLRLTQELKDRYYIMTPGQKIEIP